MISTVLYAVLVLGVLIFVHELGHFLLAKLCSVGVEKFSLGFGPKLAGFKKGETEYLISAFPLGGYVKMTGENDESELTEEQKAKSFMGKPPFKRILIVAAGPVFNLVFAWLVMIVVYMIGVPALTPKIGDVVQGKPAAAAGIKPGDVVTAINGETISRWDQIAASIAKSGGKPVSVSVSRGAEKFNFTLTPETRDSKNLFGEPVKQPVIGIVSAKDFITESYPPHKALVKGSEQTVYIIKITILSLVKLVERVVPLDSVGGPIMIAKMAGEQASQGGVSFLAFMALLSINLGVLNLLPVPILDGGHLFFYIYELIFRKPVSMRARELAQQAGLFLLVSLMILAFYNDIMRYVIG